MKLKQIPKEELELMGYDDIALLILQESGKKMKLRDIFTKVCAVLELPEETVEEKIADFFELLSINKKFVLLPNGYWDLSTNHLQDIVVEDEEEDFSDSTDEIDEEDEMDEEEDVYYDDDLDVTEDEEEDDLKDLVIIDDSEEL